MKKYTPLQATEKIRHYCAYQERSHQETRNKLYEYGLYTSEVDEILTELINDGFLNEERFAKAFAGGKFRIKKWGKIKIVRELESRGISKNCLKIALREISDDDDQITLREILKKKIDQATDDNSVIIRDKAAKYGMQKGFEPELIWKELKELLPK